MKKNNIILISLIIVVLTALCTIAGTYAVIINVTNENGTDKIINNIDIKDLLTNDNGTYNNTYYQVKNELNVTEEEMNILMNSEPLNNKLKLVLDSIVKYSLRNNKEAKYSNDEMYNMIIEGINSTPNISEELKNKVKNNQPITVITNNDIEISYDVVKYNPDILKIVNYFKGREGVNPHLVNPIYLKKTEAEEKANL